ncbi:MAG: serine/threonine-protein phosphatase [Frankia sp.]|nr:serine/threonine-protein phosphatase [Frankia sp.]
MPSKPDRALALGLVVLLAAIGIGLLTGVALAGWFGIAALLVAAARGPRRTAAIGLLALVMAVVSGTWDDRFGSSQHLAAIGLVATQSAVAVWISVHRSRRESELRRVRAVADVAQRALLPEVPATIDGASLAARYLSAAEEASVGGDLYEVVATSHTIRVVIGDVRGKGLPAVRLASVVLGAFREAAVTWLEPEQVAAACGRAVSREADVEDFVTALMVDIHPDGRLSVCSAGHHPPMMVPAAGKAGPIPVKSPSPPFGIAERYSPSAARWEVGDRLLLFTDGLIEARSPAGDFFPLEDYLDLLREGTPAEALDRLTELVTAHAGGHLRDDLAMLLIERRPPAIELPRQASASRPAADQPSKSAPVAALPSADSTPDESDNGAGDEPQRRATSSGWRRRRSSRASRTN